MDRETRPLLSVVLTSDDLKRLAFISIALSILILTYRTSLFLTLFSVSLSRLPFVSLPFPPLFFFCPVVLSSFSHFFSFLLSLSIFCALVHYHDYRRMTTNNNSSNSKRHSPLPPSLVPSFNHHRFVSFGPGIPSIVDVSTTVVSSYLILQSSCNSNNY